MLQQTGGRWAVLLVVRGDVGHQVRRQPATTPGPASLPQHNREKRVKHFNCFCQLRPPTTPTTSSNTNVTPLLPSPDTRHHHPNPLWSFIWALDNPHFLTMASFFDLKARKQAAANGAGVQKQDKAAEPPRAQPWVEK